MRGLAITLLLLALAGCRPQPAGGDVTEPRVLAASAPAAIELGREPVAVSVPLPAAANERILAVAGPAPGRLRLVLEGVELLRPGVPYQVFLNLPEGTAPDPEGPYFLGYVGGFGKADGGETTRGFDVTDAVAALRARGEWSGAARVILVPGHDAAELTAAGPYLRLRRVAILER